MAIDGEAERSIRALHTRYVRVIDDDALEEWPALFAEAGVYRIVTRENYASELPLAILSCEGRGMMHDRVTAMRRINVYEPQRYSHQISGLEIVQIAPTAYECVSSFLVVRTMHTGAVSIFASGVYRDRVIIDDFAARFAERIAIIESRQVDTLLVIPI
jgi:anthranilate 1,2-dioxygenase small subunit